MRVEFVEVSDDVAAAMIQVSDEDIAAWLKKEEKAAKADYMKTKDTRFKNPKRFVFQTACDAAAKDAIAKETDDAKKKALEATRKENGTKADQLLASKPGTPEAEIYLMRDLTEDAVKAEFGEDVLKALGELKPEKLKVVETDKAFVVPT